ncbi:helix-turn-helix domain-containing protein, partial [Ruminiclostridium cellobioparum]
VSSLSRAFNYNSNYLSRIFKLETGTALQDYIIQVRIEKAKALLAQGERVSDVSAKVGYENFPHFSRIFKKVVGVSPKQYQVNFTG